MHLRKTNYLPQVRYLRNRALRRTTEPLSASVEIYRSSSKRFVMLAGLATLCCCLSRFNTDMAKGRPGQTQCSIFAKRHWSDLEPLLQSFFFYHNGRAVMQQNNKHGSVGTVLIWNSFGIHFGQFRLELFFLDEQIETLKPFVLMVYGGLPHWQIF